MTIEKGRPWGEEVARPADLRIVGDDATLAAALRDGEGPAAAAAGDMYRTLGARPIGTRERVLALPIDLVEVTLDDQVARVALAHVVARTPWWAGSWWRGPVLIVMNAEFLGDWDVAHRGHPNDGRVEVQLADAALTARDRWAARTRLPLGSHVPHPQITTRSVRSASWTFDRPLAVFVDGRPAGTSRAVSVEVHPDAATLYA